MNTLSGKTVLVTGADGFIGSHLVEHLVRQGVKVRAFSLYNSFGTWGWLDRVDPEVQGAFEVFSGDIRDPSGVATAMRECDVVLHLAALIAIPYSYHSPDTYIDTNIKGTLNVLQAARQLGTERVVHTSTSEVYGTAQFVPITEEHPLVGQSPYSASKIGADQLALSFYRSFGTPVTVIRPFNTFGPRQSTRAVLPTIITQLAAGSKEIRLGKLSPTRDFTYVADTAKAFQAMAESPDVLGEVVNFGSGFEISIEDSVRTIIDIMGVDATIISEEQRQRPELSEVDRLWAGIDKAKRLTDWKPEHSGREGFARGIRKTIEWFSDRNNLALYKADTYGI